MFATWMASKSYPGHKFGLVESNKNKNKTTTTITTTTTSKTHSTPTSKTQGPIDFMIFVTQTAFRSHPGHKYHELGLSSWSLLLFAFLLLLVLRFEAVRLSLLMLSLLLRLLCFALLLFLLFLLLSTGPSDSMIFVLGSIEWVVVVGAVVDS